MKRLVAILLAFGTAAHAQTLELPGGARLVVSEVENPGRYEVPVDEFDGETVPDLDMVGAIQRQVWTVDGPGQTVVQLTELLAAQLAAGGFRKVLDCLAEACGGFDFRFGIDVLPAPQMYVNLRDFQFLTFLKGPEDAPDQATTILASVNSGTGYVQIIEVRASGDGFSQPSVPAVAAEPEASEERATDPVVADTPLAQVLLDRGSVVLDGLEFQSGATELGEGPFEVLDALAQFLRDNPNLNIALVGHTDSTGGFDGNLAVSKARAGSVRDRLVAVYGANGAKIRAEGMGYLAPRASNLTEAGREANRRVEAILLSSE